MRTIKAVDVSEFQHPNGEPIDWARVAASGVRGAVIKATEGGPEPYINPWLERDARGAHGAGLHTAFYHFAHPAESTADLQAEVLAEAVRGLPRDIGIALDLEQQPFGNEAAGWAALSAWAKAWMAWWEGKAKTIVLYCDPYFLSCLEGAPWGHHLWLAAPGARAPRRQRDLWGWQYLFGGVCPGIAGPVDRDEIYLEEC